MFDPFNNVLFEALIAFSFDVIVSPEPVYVPRLLILTFVLVIVVFVVFSVPFSLLSITYGAVKIILFKIKLLLALLVIKYPEPVYDIFPGVLVLS